MKNYLIIAFLLLIASTMIIISCDSNDLSNVEIQEISQLDPCIVGEFHNYALNRIISSVPDKGNAITQDKGMEFIRQLYRESYSDFSDELIFNGVEQSAIKNSLLLEVVHDDFKNINSSEINNHINFLFQGGLISELEVELVRKAYEEAGNLIELQELLTIWESQNFNTSTGEGVISKSAICLSISSTKYWAINNHNEGEIVTRISPAHVDVGGLIVGMGLTALAQDDLGWDDVPNIIAGGVMTGVVASSGIAGKIGRWLFGG